MDDHDKVEIGGVTEIEYDRYFEEGQENFNISELDKSNLQK